MDGIAIVIFELFESLIFSLKYLILFCPIEAKKILLNSNLKDIFLSNIDSL